MASMESSTIWSTAACGQAAGGGFQLPSCGTMLQPHGGFQTLGAIVRRLLVGAAGHSRVEPNARCHGFSSANGTFTKMARSTGAFLCPSASFISRGRLDGRESSQKCCGQRNGGNFRGYGRSPFGSDERSRLMVSQLEDIVCKDITFSATEKKRARTQVL